MYDDLFNILRSRTRFECAEENTEAIAHKRAKENPHFQRS